MPAEPGRNEQEQSQQRDWKYCSPGHTEENACFSRGQSYPAPANDYYVWVHILCYQTALHPHCLWGGAGNLFAYVISYYSVIQTKQLLAGASARVARWSLRYYKILSKYKAAFMCLLRVLSMSSCVLFPVVMSSDFQRAVLQCSSWKLLVGDSIEQQYSLMKLVNKSQGGGKNSQFLGLPPSLLFTDSPCLQHDEFPKGCVRPLRKTQVDQTANQQSDPDQNLALLRGLRKSEDLGRLADEMNGMWV